MTHKPIASLWIILVLLIFLGTVGGAAYASLAVPVLELGWWTSDAGGTLDTASGIYQLSGTLGQHDSDTPTSVGIYRLSPGFWPGAVTQYEIFLPAIRK